MVLNDDISDYVEKYKSLGYSEEQIKSSLIKSNIPLDLVESYFVKKEVVSKKIGVILFFGIVIFVLIVLLILFSFISSGDCSDDGVCSKGYVCSDNQCVQKMGVLNCQVDVSCEEGYDCYKCLKESVM